MYQIVTDTSANLDSELLQKYHLKTVPFSYFVNGVEHTCTDTEAFDGRAFFGAMREGVVVTTSQVTPQRYVDHFTPILEKGVDILFVGMSSGISGSYACAQMAREELLQSFPERSIRLVDTLGASLGEGLLVLRAVEYQLAGIGLEEAGDRLEALRGKMCQVFTVEDLAYLKRTGRLSSLSAVVGTVLNIKPLLKGNSQGQIVSFAKVRGRAASIEALAKQYDAMVKDAHFQTVGIAHADCPEDAKLLQKLLKRNNPPKEILTVMYEPVTGSHVGPGTLALFFMGDEEFRKS